MKLFKSELDEDGYWLVKAEEATLDDLKAALADHKMVAVPVEPNAQLLEDYREMHWELRGIQLCKEDYRGMHLTMVKAAEGRE